jgi:hypothetical protein
MSTPENATCNSFRPLPIEILQAIFAEVLDSKPASFALPILRFSHVCTLWRTSALSRPRLWTHLEIPVDLPGTSTSAIAEMFLRLSRSLPMRWSFGVTGNYDMRKNELGFHLLTSSFDWEFLRMNGHRCQKICFYSGVSFFLFPTLFPSGIETRLANLERIMVLLGDRHPEDNYNKIGTVDAPKLFHLNTHDSELIFHLFNSHPPASIQHLYIRPWDSGTPALITACRKNLRSLVLDCATGVHTMSPQDDAIMPEPVELPALENMTVYPCPGFDIQPFVEALDTPELKVIGIYTDYALDAHDVSLDGVAQAGEQSPALETLSVGPVCPDRMDYILDRMPYLTSLLLQEMDLTNARKMLRCLLNLGVCADLQTVYLNNCEITAEDDLLHQVREKRKSQEPANQKSQDKQSVKFRFRSFS